MALLVCVFVPPKLMPMLLRLKPPLWPALASPTRMSTAPTITRMAKRLGPRSGAIEEQSCYPVIAVGDEIRSTRILAFSVSCASVHRAKQSYAFRIRHKAKSEYRRHKFNELDHENLPLEAGS
jgi:hypothetical protein